MAPLLAMVSDAQWLVLLALMAVPVVFVIGAVAFLRRRG